MSHLDHEQSVPGLHVSTVVPSSELSATAPSSDCRDHHDAILADESRLIPNVPAKQSQRMRGRISQVRQGPRYLGLSTSDWADLDLGDEPTLRKAAR